jgi:hypothetical protein
MCLGGRQAAAPVKRVGGYEKDHYNGNIFDPKPVETIKEIKEIKKKKQTQVEDTKEQKLASGLAKGNYQSAVNKSGLSIT